MSDVHVTTSWTVQPNGDFEYNGVLGCAGYDTDNNRLFVSAQSPPNLAGNVTTPYCRGFHLTADYNGNLKSIPTDNESADLKRVRFTMSFTDSSYDLTGTRCYCQFANYFNVSIASWVFKHIATDAAETAIASGLSLAQRDKIQIDFINDYGDGQFIFEFEYADATPPTPVNAPAIIDNTNLYNNFYMYGTVQNSGDIWDNVTSATVYAVTVAGSQYYYITDDASATGYNYIGYYYTVLSNRKRYTGQNIGARNLGGWTRSTGFTGGLGGSIVSKLTELGYTVPNFATVNDLDTALSNGGGASGTVFKTDAVNDYDGYVWSCCLFANIAGVYPSSMSTESEGGTEGDFDTTSDALGVPDLPAEGVTLSPRAGDLYLMTESQFGIFQNAIYGSSVAQAIKALFNDVTNCILSVMTFPLPTSAYTTRFNSNVFAGGQDLGNTTECAVVKRYVEYDCGTVTLNLFWDSALDLNPYTKLNIFIPAVGMRPIDADCCMGHTIGLKYHIDLLTGSCVAFVTIDGDVYQQHTGNIGQHMAFSGTNNGLIMSGVLAGLAGNAANIAENSNPIAGAGDLVATTLNAFKVPRSVVGNFSGNTAQLAVQKPYIEIIRPIQQLPRDYTKFNAYPCYMTQQLINLSGWTEIQDIFIDDIDCTQAERDELLNLLHNGVIL